jgi:predicted oxidoreductase (fatty acid repression mutant protein)
VNLVIDLIKAGKKDMSKLTAKVVTDKNGVSRKVYVNNHTDVKDVKTKKPDPVSNKKPGSYDEHLAKYTGNHDALLADMKKDGHSWKESDNKGINVMRAKMALKAHYAGNKSTPVWEKNPKLVVVEPKKKVESVKKVEPPKPKTKKEVAMDKMNPEDLRKSKIVGIVGTDSESVAYVTKHLFPKYRDNIKAITAQPTTTSDYQKRFALANMDRVKARDKYGGGFIPNNVSKELAKIPDDWTLVKPSKTFLKRTFSLRNWTYSNNKAFRRVNLWGEGPEQILSFLGSFKDKNSGQDFDKRR